MSLAHVCEKTHAQHLAGLLHASCHLRGQVPVLPVKSYVTSHRLGFLLCHFDVMTPTSRVCWKDEL